MEISAANRLRIGQVVTLDGVKWMVKDKPFGGAGYFNGTITSEEVTLTLRRERRITRMGETDLFGNVNRGLDREDVIPL